MMGFCPACGSPFDGGDYCTLCGGPIPDEGQIPPETATAREATVPALRTTAKPRATVAIAAVVVLTLLAAGVVITARQLGPDSSQEDAAPSATGPITPAPTEEPLPDPTPSSDVREGCGPLPTPPASPESWQAAPPMQLRDGTAYTLTLATNCGDIVIETAPAEAPETVNSMLWLAGQGHFDSTLCHRLVTEGIYVLQCGDPTATGTGGPGYSVPDENLPTAEDSNYPAGTVAMANAGPGTAGSQFFIVHEDTTLPPNYTIWGTVLTGLDVVEQVARAGVIGGGSDGSPVMAVGIESAVVG